MAKKKKQNYNQTMADTFESMVYCKYTDHEQCAYKNGNGLKQEFTESSYGWAMKCLSIADKYRKEVKL